MAVLAATMSESAIDSLQNAIVDNISGSFLKGLPLIWIRVLVVILSVPVIIVSLQVRTVPHGLSRALHSMQLAVPYLSVACTLFCVTRLPTAYLHVHGTLGASNDGAVAWHAAIHSMHLW